MTLSAESVLDTWPRGMFALSFSQLNYVLPLILAVPMRQVPVSVPACYNESQRAGVMLLLSVSKSPSAPCHLLPYSVREDSPAHSLNRPVRVLNNVLGSGDGHRQESPGGTQGEVGLKGDCGEGREEGMCL